jgi:dolichol-phosphate mannosyltransferase
MFAESRRNTLVSTLDIEDNADQDKRVDTSLIGLQPISVIIPTLNESANIANLLIRLDRTLTQADIPYEAIVVDDHSTDDTIAVAEAVAIDKILSVRILPKQGRRGKSFSLMEGFAAARFDVLVMMDGDLQHPPEILPDMLYRLLNSDIVVADRRSYKNPNRLRGLLSNIFIFIFNMLFGINTDIESGLKVFRRKVYEGLPPNPGRWDLDLYLVTHAVRKGNILINMPFAIQQRQGGKSKVKPLTVGMELLIAMLHLKMTLVLDSISSRISNRQ